MFCADSIKFEWWCIRLVMANITASEQVERGIFFSVGVQFVMFVRGSCGLLDFNFINQKPVPTNTIHQLGTEISKDMGKVSEMEKVRETKSAELRTTEAKIKEVGLKYSEKVSS